MILRRIASLWAVPIVVLSAGEGRARAEGDRVEECIAAAERGQELVRDGRIRAAGEHFAKCVQSDCPAAVQRDCARFAAESAAAVATLTVGVVDERGVSVNGARVLIDGVATDARNDSTPMPLDPGPHTIEAITERDRASTSVVLAAGERDRRVALRVRTHAPEARRPVPASTWLLGGTGIVGLAAFGVFGALGTAEVHDVRERCAPHCAQSELTPATTKLLVGDIALLVGVVSLSVAAVLYVTRPSVPVTTARAF